MAEKSDANKRKKKPIKTAIITLPKRSSAFSIKTSIVGNNLYINYIRLSLIFTNFTVRNIVKKYNKSSLLSFSEHIYHLYEKFTSSYSVIFSFFI